MVTNRKRRERRRAGSEKRDSTHRAGGDWTTISIPEGVEIWQPKEGSQRIDVVPYEVADGNPYADKGEWYYERTFWTHRGVGPNNETYVCPAKTVGKPCPVCEHRSRLVKDPDADEKLADALKPKERQLWLIFDHAQEDKGVQIWEFSHWNFGRLLDKRRKNADEDEAYIMDFDDPDAGSTLKVSFNEEKGGGYTYLEAYSIDFKPRKNGLSEEVLEHGICLDGILKVLPYDKLKAVFLQEETEDEETEDEETEDEETDDEPDEKPTRKTKARTKTKLETAEDAGLEEGMMVKHNDLGVCEIVRISRDGTSLMLEDEEGDKHKAIGPDEVAPVKKKEKTKPKPTPDDDDWDDGDEWEEKKTKTKPKAKAKSKAKPETDDDDDDDDDDWD